MASATATRRPPLRLHRPGGDAALERVAVGVCREFGAADALTVLRAARQLGRLALDAGEPDAAAATVVLVQLAIDRLEADAAAVLDGLAETLDGVHDYYRAALREVIRYGDRKKYAVKKQPVDRVTTERTPEGVGGAAESRAAEVLRATNDPGRPGWK